MCRQVQPEAAKLGAASPGPCQPDLRPGNAATRAIYSSTQGGFAETLDVLAQPTCMQDAASTIQR